MTLRVLAFVACWATPLSAQRGWSWRPDERVTIGDYSMVHAVAASRDAMYAPTTNGLISWDRRARKWSAPLSTSDAYPAGLVTSAAVDPGDHSVWLGTRTGLLHYRPAIRTIDAVDIAGGVSDLAFDRDDPLAGIFFSTRLGWQQLPPGRITPDDVAGPPPAPRRIGTAGLLEVLRRFPGAEALAPTTLLDAQLRPYRFTAAAVTPDGDDAYFGTDGLGVLRFDAFGARFERMSFGLLGQSVGAVAVDSLVWSGTGPGNARAGLTAVDADIQRFRHHEARAGTFRSVRDLALRGGEVWAATENGVTVLSADGSWKTFDRVAGLPSDNVLSLASSASGVWVGTDRGLAWVRGDTISSAPASRAVTALLELRDTLWLGTSTGVMVLAPGNDDLLLPRDRGTEPALRDAIVSIVAIHDTIVAATADRLVTRVPGQPWMASRVVTTPLGVIRVLAADSGGVWIGGERGLGFFRLAGRDLVTFRVPDDVPGPVQDLAVHGRYLWVATPEGLVRFDRKALRL